MHAASLVKVVAGEGFVLVVPPFRFGPAALARKVTCTPFKTLTSCPSFGELFALSFRQNVPGSSLLRMPWRIGA